MIKLIIRSYIEKIDIKADSSVTIPSSEGILTILPNHEDLSLSLNLGIISIDDKIIYFIYGGIANINDNVIDIITEFARDITNISSEELDDEILKIKKSLETSKINLEINKYQKHLKYYTSLKEYI
jgi:F0F1-type ATP synthase epsilon subunit